jgi:tRNA (guanine10-N2)-dimethyltransferase
MSNFEAKSICILGRQPALGLAELESLYGAEHVRPAGTAAVLDIPAEQISFSSLGGTIKVAKLLTVIDSIDWKDLARYLFDKIPEHTEHLPGGKFTLGLSVYGHKVPIKQIEAALLEVKKLIRQTGRPVRIVPNKQPALNSAQVLHNKLTHKGAWELLFIKDGQRTLLAQTLFVQDIEAYGARDQARPARDARVGMLPPKLAQIMVNLAAGHYQNKEFESWDKADGLRRVRILDPFCGTGVILQEALLIGYSVYGTDIEPRMVEYSQRNIRWLFDKFPSLEGQVDIEAADATSYQWAGFSAIASETFLGRPLAKMPDEAALKQIISDANTVIKKFLQNIAPQLKTGQSLCLAVPEWRHPVNPQSQGLDGVQGAVEQRTEPYMKYGEGATETATPQSAKSASGFRLSRKQAGAAPVLRLPLLDKLTEMGYTYWDLKHVRREELVYYREDQVVARRLLRIRKA